MSESRPAPIRHHDLDALRATAMLLGIVLHACTPFMPFYGTDNAVASTTLRTFIRIVHAFRMPLFFLISGFFSAMLWHRRGALSLLRHRAKRVLLPFVLSVIVVVPLVGWGFRTGERLSGQPVGERPNYFIMMLSPFDLKLTHLWFLWMLWVLVCGFALVVGIGSLIERFSPSLGAWFLRGRGVFIVAMVAVTAVGQYAMVRSLFGAGYTEKLLLDPTVVLYYSRLLRRRCRTLLARRGHPPTVGARDPTLGAAVHRRGARRRAGTHARGAQPRPVPGLPSRVHLVRDPRASRDVPGGLLDVPAMGSVALGCLLLDVPDAPPLVFVFQGLVTPWPLPFYVKVALVFVFTLVPILVTYQYGVRYTPIGTLLNGKRTRPSERNPQLATV